MSLKLAWLATPLLLVCVHLTEAQQPSKIPRIGVLTLGSGSSGPNVQALRERLHELGYVEGRNVIFEYRDADGNADRLSELADDLIRRQVSVIVTTSTASVLAANKSTSKIPIVAATSGDLVGTGLVASLARPGGNVTGLTAISPELSGKRLELLKQILPNISRAAVLWHPSKWDEVEVKQTELAAAPLGVKIQSVQVRGPNDFVNAFGVIRKERAHAIIIIQGPFLGLHRKQVLDFNAENRLPSICDSPLWTQGGCLASYGPNRADLLRRAAMYVDKILKGANPAELPVEQPTKFELVINLKTAKQIGLTIPPNVLARADRVIR